MQTPIEHHDYENLRTFYISVGKDDLNKKELACNKSIRSENIKTAEFELLLQVAKKMGWNHLYLPYNFFSHPRFQTLIAMIKDHNLQPIFEATTQNFSLIVHECKKYFDNYPVIFNFVILKPEDLVKTKEFHDLKNLQFSILFSNFENIKNIFKKMNIFKIKKVHFLNIDSINDDLDTLNKILKIAAAKNIEVARTRTLEFDSSNRNYVEFVSGLKTKSFGSAKNIKASVILTSISDIKGFVNSINNILRQTIPSEFFEIIVVIDKVDMILQNKVEQIIEQIDEKTSIKVLYFKKIGQPNTEFTENALVKNIGETYADGDNLIFINSGTIVGPDFIEEVIIKLNYWDVLQFQIQYYSENEIGKNQLLYTDLIPHYKIEENEKYHDLDFCWEKINSNVFAISRNLFRKKGGFRISLDLPGFENIDFCFRSLKALSLHKSGSTVFECKNKFSFKNVEKALELNVLTTENFLKLLYFNPSYVLIEYIKTTCLNQKRRQLYANPSHKRSNLMALGIFNSVFKKMQLLKFKACVIRKS